MSGGHGHGVFVHGDSLVHRMGPHEKILAALAFVVVVVLTPHEVIWAFGAFLVLVLAAGGSAGLSPWFFFKRIVLEIPFVIFAVALPFVGGGPRVDVAGIALSVDGLWAAFNILAKATLGLFATIVVAATTPSAELIRGMNRLRLPRIMVGILSFMIRYAEVLGGEIKRMGIARELRGGSERWLWQARAVATTLGTVFVRSFERGERVYVAMLSRGYAGAFPELEPAAGSRPGALAGVVLLVPTVLVGVLAQVMS